MCIGEQATPEGATVAYLGSEGRHPAESTCEPCCSDCQVVDQFPTVGKHEQSSTTRRQKKWCKPANDLYKINSDGSFSRLLMQTEDGAS
jgi:hypothetical protein